MPDNKPQLDFIRRRYNHIAAIYPVFDYLFFLPVGITQQAVQRLRLKEGDAVLEVGCGTGRNLPYLVDAVGPTGQVYGIDISESMLARAARLRERHQWQNVTLIRGDAHLVHIPVALDGILFSLSYSVIPNHVEVLGRFWRQLRQFGRVVIVDAKLVSGRLGSFLRPLLRLMSNATVLGKLDAQPSRDVQELSSHVTIETRNFGTYFICSALKADAGGTNTLMVS